ncbi:alanine dehydrogenase [Propioniciclava sinopodophylli]|uniref:alanine dehydrogenase n=1 Tax=Propioniciclava sinopodophylli TaxID=1837344 RepID=UPI002490D908|nr:alanine dehydrogenase [Propioniciclava sinopodophylli]
MRVSIPKETKVHEYRVAITPVGVHDLVEAGHEVLVETGAGAGSAIQDADYEAVGARSVDTDAAWSGDLVLKVKEPTEDEFKHLRDDMVLFTYLHLAPDRPLTEALLNAGTTAVAYETVRLPNGQLPLLYPMSEVAGCLAPQVGANALLRAHGGRGVLMGGVAGVPSAKVVVLGGGIAGQNAASVALGMGADVTVLDTDLNKLRDIMWKFDDRVDTLVSSTLTVREQVLAADLVIGTVLVPGARTPKLVTNDMVAQMKPGAVLVDVAVDQGGCFEDSHPTTHDDPTFTVHDTIFYCVANMPGAVPTTSTQALTNSTLPYVRRIANEGWADAAAADPALAEGLNTIGGRLAHPGVIEAFPDLPAVSPQED